MFRSADEIVFDLVNDNISAMGSPDILQWLNGRVAGLESDEKWDNPRPTLEVV